MSYIRFVETEKKPKTSVYRVMSESSGMQIGQIQWYGPWRQYGFAPDYATVWNDECLKEIVTFLAELREKRKAPCA